MAIMAIITKEDMLKTNKEEEVLQIMIIHLEVEEQQLYLHLEVVLEVMKRMEQEGNLVQDIMITIILVQEVNHLEVEPMKTIITLEVLVPISHQEPTPHHQTLHLQEVRDLVVMEEVDHLVVEAMVVAEDHLVVVVEEEDR
jgi:hypothetical protein